MTHTAESDARCWRSECRNACYYPQGCSERPTVGGMPRAEWDERMRIEVALGELPDETTRVTPPEVGAS